MTEQKEKLYVYRSVDTEIFKKMKTMHEGEGMSENQNSFSFDIKCRDGSSQK
jgi:hypothetical protein